MYVQFLPDTWEALNALQEAIDAFEGEENPIEDNDPYLFHYPLHKEVLQEGLYYHDPSIPVDQPSYHYAVVKPDFSIPAGVTAVILAELVNVPYNTYIMAEAFRRVGATYYDVQGGVMSTCTPSCPNYPQCFNPVIDCNSGGVEPLPVPCEPSVSLAGCPQLFIPTPLTPINPLTNSCGCVINETLNQPSGCVQVEDTQLGWEGVRRLKVYVKDLYFFGRETWTSHEGCWRINYSYFGGIHPYLDWYNNKISFRAMRGFDYTQLGHRLKQDCGTHGGGVYNDFQVQHPSFGDNSSIRRTFWAASAGLNAYYEFNSYANGEGIGTAHGADVLSVWLLNDASGAGAAPMLKDLGRNTTTGNALNAGVAFIGAIFLPLGTYISPSIQANMPDMIYNYGIAGLTSDDMKETYYHEYAHVAHYRGLPTADRYGYWLSNILRIITNSDTGDNPPYGSPTTTGAGRTAIMESWATHVGLIFADKQYGINNRRSVLAQTANEKQGERFIYRGLERFNPNSASLDAWIPDGVYWDLFDDSTHNVTYGIIDRVTDNVQGVSNANMFRAITQNAPTDVLAVRDAIRAGYPNKAVQIDSLYIEYGY